MPILSVAKVLKILLQNKLVGPNVLLFTFGELWGASQS
jgi:hypothetical protein